MSEEQPKANLSNKLSIIVLVAIIIIVLGAFLAWLYTGSFTQAKSNVFSKLPLPVALVGSRLVTGPELVDRLQLANKLPDEYKTAATDLNTLVYDQLVDSKKIANLASAKGLSVNSKEVDEEYQRVVDQYADGDTNKFKDTLKGTYGMTESEFKANVLRQDILQNKLAVWFNGQENLNQAAYKTAKDLTNKLNSGTSFDDVAKEYTQDEATKDFAGDSGFVAVNDLLPEFQAALKDAETGSVKQISSRYGLHILKLLEKDNNGENGAARVHLQQIFVKENSFEEWFNKETDNIRVVKFLKV